MRRSALLLVIVMLGAPALAQDGTVLGPEDLTHGEFAALLIAVASPPGSGRPDALTALEDIKRMELAPADWQPEDMLNQGELADVMASLGVLHVPAKANAPVSRSYAEAMMRRELSRLRDYLARRMGHGFSASHVMDEGVDRAISPSGF